VSFSLTHFNLADTTTLDIVSIAPDMLEIALIVQLTLDAESMFAEVNITASADAWTLLTASDDAETFLNNTAALETELCESIVDATLKMTIALQLTEDWLTTLAAAPAIL
jgi:hypothetical protein